jgi:hypothetical protein
VAAVIDRKLRLHAPHLLSDCVPLGTADPNRMDAHREALGSREDLFSGLEHRVFEHERLVAVGDWIAELTTHSPVMLLDGLVAKQLLAELAGEVESEVGETVHIAHATYAVRARRR